ncbi:hypothetical protein KAH55_12385, partial [bacterium]|nr:hypothetical protein [bacterium]
MNIAIDATMLTPHSGGILRYGLNLLPALNRFRGRDRYFIFCQKNFAAIYPEIAALPDIVPIDWPRQVPYARQLLGPLKWHGWLKRINADLFHSLISYQPTGIRVPTVITVHDLRALE